jgi:hypothetical protein
MKKIGEYTTMGQIASGEELKIQLFDGRFDTGYRIVGFTIVPASVKSGDNACGKLTTEPDPGGEPGVWDFGSNIEVAWSGTYGVSDGIGGSDDITDPDNMIIEDLYVSGLCSDATDRVNYIVYLEKYDISDWKGALSMVRNKSQG